MATFSFLTSSEEVVATGSPADTCYPSTCLESPNFWQRRGLVENVSSPEVRSDGALHPFAAINVRCSQPSAATWGESPNRRRQVFSLLGLRVGETGQPPLP